MFTGAPVATPLDPRHRLVTTKYNPARTGRRKTRWVLAGPTFASTAWRGRAGISLSDARYRCGIAITPWRILAANRLLRFFDQIRFYPVSAEELLTIRRDFPLGRYPLRIEHTTLKLAEYQQFADEASEIEAFRAHQQAAFDAERERWAANGQAHFDSSEVLVTDGEDAPLAPGQAGIDSPVSGNLWQVNVEVGNTVREGDVLVVLESMKMEIPLVATRTGWSAVRVQPGSSVRAGQCVVVPRKQHEAPF